MKFILAKKVGMTRIFDEEGRNFAVTIVKPLNCKVSALKTKEKDGYEAVQIIASKDSTEKTAKTCEFRVKSTKRYKVGDSVAPKQFKKDEMVNVEGTGKGKGFAGTIKRHDFSRGPVTHGSHNVRQPGSIGGGYPQRVVLGRKMAGHMGAKQVTIKNLKLVDLDDEIMLIKGAIPGPVKSIVKVFGEGEKAEETIDFAAEEERIAQEKMLEAEKEAKAETDKEQSDKSEEKVEE